MKITLEIPDNSIAMNITVLCGDHSYDLSMITKGVTTDKMKENATIKIERKERNYED